MTTQKKANENNLSVRKDIRIDKKLLVLIDSVRGDVPFSTWIKRAAIQRLANEGHTAQEPDHQHISVIEKQAETNQIGKRTTFEERVELVRQCYDNGLGYRETAKWLNDKGYLPQRGSEFTPASVRGVAKSLNK